MIDLHVHTYFSDGRQSPAVALRYARAAGYRAIAITDHVDPSNLRHTIESLLPVTKSLSLHAGIDAFVGVELTHVPPALIPDMVQEARDLGAQLINVHGQTLADIVEEGTNLAAIEAKADILCHPGLITEQEAELAAEHNVMLEISTRAGHCYTNAHVYNVAKLTGANLVMNNDAHHYTDFVPKDKQRAIALGAGMSPEDIRQMKHNSHEIVSRLLGR